MFRKFKALQVIKKCAGQPIYSGSAHFEKISGQFGHYVGYHAGNLALQQFPVRYQFWGGTGYGALHLRCQSLYFTGSGTVSAAACKSEYN